jgi:hypothetical protein
MRKLSVLSVLMSVLLTLVSCESEQTRKARLAREEQQRIELAQQKENARIEREKRAEQERLEREARLEQERKEKAIHDRYINNSLSTGAMPYSRYYGDNPSCNSYGCSQISVKTPYNSDVLVTIKRNGKVVRHAYIRAGNTYTFSFPDGTYQPFFYYGKGWNPEKEMTRSDETVIYGGFIEDEIFGKDSPQTLANDILEYELILQRNGNFSTKPSTAQEAL